MTEIVETACSTLLPENCIFEEIKEIIGNVDRIALLPEIQFMNHCLVKKGKFKKSSKEKYFSNFHHQYGVYFKSAESVIPPAATFWVCLKVFEMLVDKNYNVSEQIMQPDNSELCEDEKNIVDYIGAYVIHCITKHASRLSNSEDKSQILMWVAALTLNTDEAVNTTTATISKSLTSVLDRGGLKKLNPKSLQIFLCLEFVLNLSTGIVLMDKCTYYHLTCISPRVVSQTVSAVLSMSFCTRLMPQRCIFQRLAHFRKVQPPRSQPAIGLKHTAKAKPTIFGTITETRRAKNEMLKSVEHQRESLSQMFDKAGRGYDCQLIMNCNENDVLVFKDGNLVSGSAEALIQHLVPTTESNPDRTYVFTFLLSSRLFIRPHELLAEVCHVCTFQENLSSDNVQKHKLGKFVQNIVQLISEWTEMFPYDFRDERMMKQLREITQWVLKVYPELQLDVNTVTYNLLNKLAGLNHYEEVLSKLNTESIKRSQTLLTPTTNIMEVCPNPLCLAEQLTHIELERLSQIGPEEFVQAFVKDEVSNQAPVFIDMKKTHNLEAYVQWCNRLSYFVASEICSRLKRKNRVKLVEYFINVAKECINIGNFNSLMAIITGMNMNPVARLKKTWAKVNKVKFEILELQMNPSNNFGSYRSCLKAAMWRAQGATDNKEKIVIPLFSLFIKDIYFLYEGCANRSENGNINFQKFWSLAKHISDFITWQQVQCPSSKHSDVLHYILTSPVFSESTLSLASYECESPVKSYDKARHKKLKAEAGL